MERQLHYTLRGLTGFIAGVILCGIITWLCPHGRTDVDAERDTVFDTLTFIQPIVRDSTLVRYVTRTLPVQRDSIITHYRTVTIQDSVPVVIPITQKVYKDSTYQAWISGYEASLDSIKIATPTITVTKKVPKRWGVGVQAGYGTGGAYIGIGISYNLITF